MPIRKLAKVYRHEQEADHLLKQLVTEWTHPSPAGFPVIIEDGGGARPIHLYVIWDQWDPLNQIERSEIIMDACEQVFGKDKTLNVTVAMGLTPTEAEGFGISYQ